MRPTTAHKRMGCDRSSTGTNVRAGLWFGWFIPFPYEPGVTFVTEGILQLTCGKH
jgi:hypothetical protein